MTPEEDIKHSCKITSWFSRLTSYQRIGLVLTGIWVVCQLVFLYADDQGKDYVDDTVWLIDTDFSDFYAYGSGEFVFYAFLIPTILWGLLYIYHLSKKIGIIIIVLMTIGLLCHFGIVKYHHYQVEQREKAINDSILAANNSPKINRTFAGCSLGDSFDKVNKVIHSIYKNDSIITFWGVKNGSLTNDNRITLYDIKYGNRTYTSIKFSFYHNKLAKVLFKKEYKSLDSKLGAFYSLRDLFESKNYPHDGLLYDKYSNCRYYSDKYTQLELRHSVPEHDGNDEKISICYYDKTSGMEDSGL